MTPAARIDAAIDLLDNIKSGIPAEQALTRWGRANRYAGSKDRAAVRDHVFDALRCRKSYAALGGGDSGRSVMIGALRAAGQDPASLFTGIGYAPAPLTTDELSHVATDIATDITTDIPDELTALDCPEWLAPQLRDSLGVDFAPVMQVLRQRAPVFLRVNKLLGSVKVAQNALAQDEIATRPHPLSESALEITENPRRLRNSHAYKTGLVELQDAASQAIVEYIPIWPEMRVLDYCAGGGGKTLALAASGLSNIVSHDKNAVRMRDLPVRADRAQAKVKIFDIMAVKAAAPYDLVLLDVPCSGSGAWRRSPDEKWRITPEKLDELQAVQRGILDEILDLVSPSGIIAYITCSLLKSENEDQITGFLSRHNDWNLQNKLRLTPENGADGFFIALLTR